MKNTLKCEFVERVNGNIIYRCKEHQPDAYVIIPYSDILSSAKPCLNTANVLNITLGDIKSKQWATVTSIVTAVDIARGEDFCMKTAGMRVEEYIAYDHAEFDRHIYHDFSDKDNFCDHCSGYHGRDYDTGKTICDNRCSSVA